MEDKHQLMKEINEVSFAINDLTLYLDTHPNDKDAIEMFTMCLAKRKTAMETYEANHYPLTVDCIKNLSSNGYHWSWNDTPLPWEGGMN